MADRDIYVALQRSPAFARLRSRSRRYLAVMTALFLGAMTVAIVFAAWIKPGMLLAFSLILLPAAASVVHLRYARRRLDPLAERIREDFERGRQ